MTREEAIEYWEQFNAEIDDLYDACSDADRDVLVKQREFVEYTISALRQQWISVKDRLPDQTDPAQKVLFITKTGGLFIGCYYKATAYDQFNGWYSMCVRIDNVTHWIPLPENPEEGTE